MDLVLVESPFTGNVDSNLRYLRMAMADCFARGEAPFASHGLYPQVLDDNVPEERAKCIEAGLLWGAKASRSVFYVDRGFSGGMCQGLERARQEGRPCVFRLQALAGVFVEVSEVDAMRYVEALDPDRPKSKPAPTPRPSDGQIRS
jgi:hypothetical protein